MASLTVDYQEVPTGEPAAGPTDELDLAATSVHLTDYVWSGRRASASTSRANGSIA